MLLLPPRLGPLLSRLLLLLLLWWLLDCLLLRRRRRRRRTLLPLPLAQGRMRHQPAQLPLAGRLTCHPCAARGRWGWVLQACLMTWVT